jgi:maleamate amidohydrolase
VSERVWDRFLTEQDRAHAAVSSFRTLRLGQRPAVILVDLYRAVYGDRPAPLLEAIETWPYSCGLAGWEALPPIQHLLRVARERGLPVVHTTGMAIGAPKADSVDPNGQGGGYEIVESVAPLAGELVIRKAAPSAFWGTPLIAHLQQLGVDSLIVAGESTSGCVRATVVDARTYGYAVAIPEQCVFDRTEASHAMSLFDLARKYAAVAPLDAVLTELDVRIGSSSSATDTAARKP